MGDVLTFPAAAVQVEVTSSGPDCEPAWLAGLVNLFTPGKASA